MPLLKPSGRTVLHRRGGELLLTRRPVGWFVVHLWRRGGLRRYVPSATDGRAKGATPQCWTGNGLQAARRPIGGRSLAGQPQVGLAVLALVTVFGGRAVAKQ